MGISIACFLGAGFSYVAGVPLARNLLNRNRLITVSDHSEQRFLAVREHYENWQNAHPSEYPEQYMGLVYAGKAGPNPPKWEWIVEYVCATIASVGTPVPSLNQNPRYSNRINRPFRCPAHSRFWKVIFHSSNDISVITTNYDILAERVLRHRPMLRPRSPGCFYGGLPRPQILKGAAQPFSQWAAERTIEMTGMIPVIKLHGSLNWTLNDQTIVACQDMRPVFAHGGTAAIIPPVPEKMVPSWLRGIWDEAASRLLRSEVWVVCGYSLPPYDSQVMQLLETAGVRRALAIILMSPEAVVLRERWETLLPQANIQCLPGLPEGIERLKDYLARPFG